MKRVSIKDVAREAGVSISTVSRVLNNSAPVSDDLKEKVENAIKKLDYMPSNIAKSLRKGKTGTIGFIIPDITNPFFANIVRGAEDYLRQRDYTLILCNSDQDEKQEVKLLETLISKHIDGLLFTGTGNFNPVLAEKIERGFNVVFLDRIIQGISASYVIVNNSKGMYELLDYLTVTGHKEFVFINGNKETFSAKIRYETFKKVMGEKKLKFTHFYTNFSYEAGYNFGKKMKKMPDAIVCGNDLIAYGVIDALEDRGFKIPEDVSVTGFDDIPFSKHYKPPLTTVRQPMYEMGMKAAELLVKIIEEKQINTEGIILEPQLVIRGSTRRG
ncbi:LacI family DNA-binding transcriptional regulator [Thermosipho ferrireducens]|uniref:LacI family DNA-binding transcriptional regulator n=1 Tax=Thermosipho ferrireducens TaxID=2571116 RepID=A0ABX7S4Q5_9BACT|nr:LacI family DNA-binding transcriptional regulator [Thermosipho ferrireducens]QTA37444.1 LacI family DNA-binding transcriptional regulator [Thermosipho ferrireducens]